LGEHATHTVEATGLQVPFKAAAELRHAAPPPRAGDPALSCRPEPVLILNAIQAGEGPPVVLLHGLFGAARNFGAIQRAIAPRFRVVALDMRNHGDSPHAADMRYPTLADDVRETLASFGIEKAAVIGHSMGGKAAMAMALGYPDLVGRLLVSDIAPVRYQHGNAGIADAMAAIKLTPSLTRTEADAALAAAVPRADIRAFLLQNLRFGAQPRWRIGLAEIAAAVADLEGWIDLPGLYPGPCLFVAGANSDYVLQEHRPIIRTQFPSARFVAIKHAGHWVHADNPAGFLSVLEGFLHNWL
jgi:esterase